MRRIWGLPPFFWKTQKGGNLCKITFRHNFLNIYPILNLQLGKCSGEGDLSSEKVALTRVLELMLGAPLHNMIMMYTRGHNGSTILYKFSVIFFQYLFKSK